MPSYSSNGITPDEAHPAATTNGIKSSRLGNQSRFSFNSRARSRRRQHVPGDERRLQLMTQKVAGGIPAHGANENADDYQTVLAHARLFSPYSNWTWYFGETDPQTGQRFKPDGWV